MVYITDIGAENRAVFEAFIPKEYREKKESPEYFFVGGIWEETACGAMVTHFEDYLLHIDSIYVAQDYRGLGVGTQMLLEAIGLAKEAGLGRIEICVLEDLPGNYGLEHLLRLFPCEVTETENTAYEFSLSDVDWEKMKLNPACGEKCTFLSELQEAELSYISGFMENAYGCYARLPIRKKDYVGEHSLVLMQGKEPIGIWLMHQVGGGLFQIDYMGVFGEQTSAFPEMMGAVMKSFEKTAKEVRIRTVCVNEKVGGVLKHLVKTDERKEYRFLISV